MIYKEKKRRNVYINGVLLENYLRLSYNSQVNWGAECSIEDNEEKPPYTVSVLEIEVLDGGEIYEVVINGAGEPEYKTTPTTKTITYVDIDCMPDGNNLYFTERWLNRGGKE